MSSHTPRLAPLLSLLLCAAAPSSASEQTRPVVGVGAGVNLGNVFSGGSLSASPVGVYVPINVTEAFRLEPSLGYWYVSRGSTVDAPSGLLSKGGYAVETALGAFFCLHPSPPFTVYLGGRVGAAFVGHSYSNVSGTNITSASQASVFVNPTLGLEWFVSRHFSVGSEAATAFRFYTDPSVSIGDTSASFSSSRFGMGLEVVVLLRLWL